MRHKHSNLLLLFLSLIIVAVIAEIVLRAKAYRPGYYNMGITKVDSLICYSDYVADSDDIWRHAVPAADNTINSQGFTSPYNFDTDVDSLRKTGQKIVMLIGDSYTEGRSAGCDKSFATIIDANNKYAVLNYGVGAGDPLQYELVVKKYAPIIKPDIVVVCFFTGNDIVYGERKPEPYKPILYQTNAGNICVEPWIFNLQPPHKRMVDEKESYNYLLKIMSLKSDSATLFQKIMGQTAIGTLVYYSIYTPKTEADPRKNNPVSDIHLKRIADECDSLKTKFVLIALPGIHDCVWPWRKEMRKKYARVFNSLPVHYLNNYNYNMLDYYSFDNDHFTASGNKKCSEEILQILNKE